MTGWVIDTNVLCVADRLAGQADEDCIATCVDLLDRARDGIVLLDDGGRIIAEYQNNVRTMGQPGVGALFVRWIWQNVANPAACLQVPIRQISQSPENYEEMPDDPELASFDVSDRKFVAVARAYGTGATIVNAVDSDWRNAEVAMSRNGVRIKFLCPQHV